MTSARNESFPELSEYLILPLPGKIFIQNLKYSYNFSNFSNELCCNLAYFLNAEKQESDYIYYNLKNLTDHIFLQLRFNCFPCVPSIYYNYE